MVLYFDKWITSGLLKIGNLRFINGILDEQFIYTCVGNKIDSEVSKMKKALKPYAAMIGNHEPVVNTYIPLFVLKDVYVDYFKTSKAKVFYDSLMRENNCNPDKKTYWCDVFGNQNIIFKDVYRIKLAEMKDNKLAEINLKVLCNILPCNANLVKWKKKQSEECSICNEHEDILHLFYSCVYARRIWSEFFKTGIHVNGYDIVLGKQTSITENLLINIIAYLLYKKWLLESFNGIPRNINHTLVNFRTDLSFKKTYTKVVSGMNLKPHLKNYLILLKAERAQKPQCTQLVVGNSVKCDVL